MRVYRSLLILVLIPVMAFVLSAPGCGKAKKPPRGGGDLEPEEGSAKNVEMARTEIASTGFGSLKGMVTYDGDPPQPASLKPKMEAHQDKDQCLLGHHDELIDQTWVIGPNKGVANICIFLKAPAGKYFKVADEDKKIMRTMELRQPHCTFLPHVIALYPYYYDGKELQKTGETFKVLNDAKITHNTRIAGDPAVSSPFNITLTAGDSSKAMVLQPEPKPLTINCDVHKWMSASAWVFDHPYHAVTRGEGEKDKPEDHGKYEMPRVPAGVEVTVVAWRPDAGEAGYIWGREGKKMTFKAGENTYDFKVK